MGIRLEMSATPWEAFVVATLAVCTLLGLVVVPAWMLISAMVVLSKKKNSTPKEPDEQELWRSPDKVIGLDFGKEVLQPFLPLRRRVHSLELGLMIYAQSEVCKFSQECYHLATGGIGSSVNKCVLLLFNRKDDFECAQSSCPESVTMADFKPQVLSKMPSNYEYDRAKVAKPGCSYYLYYVKKVDDSQVVRTESWGKLITKISSMDKVANWAELVLRVQGEVAPLQTKRYHWQQLVAQWLFQRVPKFSAWPLYAHCTATSLRADGIST